MYTWETGCKTFTSTINKSMDEKNEYNKRIYTTRERERERACGQKKKKKKETETNIFYNWAELVNTFQKV